MSVWDGDHLVDDGVWVKPWCVWRKRDLCCDADLLFGCSLSKGEGRGDAKVVGV